MTHDILYRHLLFEYYVINYFYVILHISAYYVDWLNVSQISMHQPEPNCIYNET